MDDFKVYLLNKVHQLESENDNLRTELKVTKQALGSLKGERDEIKAECESLRKFIIGLAEADAQIAYAYADIGVESSHD